jgi:hypothetical protein
MMRQLNRAICRLGNVIDLARDAVDRRVVILQNAMGLDEWIENAWPAVVWT